MAANNTTSLSDLNQAIDLTIAGSDEIRAGALRALGLVLSAEAVQLARQLALLIEQGGPDDPRIEEIAALIETNKAFALNVSQEFRRASVGGFIVPATDYVLDGFLSDDSGNGRENLTVAFYDGVGPDASWIADLGHACSVSPNGYFKLKATISRDYSRTPGFVRVSSQDGATLYLGETPFTPEGGKRDYIELVIGDKPLGCPAPSLPSAKVNLSITKSDTPDPVMPNAELTYTLTVANLGQTEAKDLKVIDTLAPQTTFVSASGNGFTCTHSNGVVSCTSPGLAAGATGTITIVVRVSQDVAPGTVLSNTATVSATASDSDTSNNTAVTTTTVGSAANLSITKIDAPDPVEAGHTVTYTLQVSNPVGALAAQNVTVTDAVPANTTFVSAAVMTGTGWTQVPPPAGGSGNVVFSKGSMPAGDNATFQIMVRVNANTTATTISNTATVTSPTIDPNGNATNKTVTVTTNVIPQAASADLQLAKTATPAAAKPGDTVTYSLTVTNAGPSAAQNVTITDPVPANTTFLSAAVMTGTGWTQVPPPAGGSGNVVFSKGSMPAGDNATFQIMVKINANTTAATISNTATVASPTSDPSPPAPVTVTTNVIPQAATADLQLAKTATPAEAKPGDTVTYTLTVINAGPSAAQNVTVTDAVPANTSFVSATAPSGTGWTQVPPPAGGSGNVVFSKGSMPAGERATFQIMVKINADTTATTISNTATVASPTSDPSPPTPVTVTTNVIQPAPSADLQLVKTDDPNPVGPGGNITYTLTVYNAGPSTAQTVTVTDPVPANTTFVSAAVTSGTGWATTATPVAGGTGNAVFSKASVAAGETATFKVVVNVNQNTPESTTITNTATVASPTSDPNSDNSLGIAKTSVKSPGADLSIGKTVAIAPGGIITYMLTLTNNGPNAADNVKVTDPIPANTSFVSATVTSGSGWATSAPPVGGSGTVVFSKGSVASSESASFQIVVKLNPGVPVTIVNNTATVTSSTSDPDPTHNTVEASARIQLTRRAVVFFTEVSSAGDHSPLQGSTQPSVTFTDNAPNSGDLEAAFSGPQAGFKMKQFKAVTMAVVSGSVDADIKGRLKAVVSALQNAGGAATLTTSTIMLSARDRTALTARGISLTEIDEVIFLELVSGV